MAADEPAHEIRGCVVREDGDQNREDGDPAEVGKVAQQEQMPEPERDPRCSEDRRAHRHRGGLPRLRDPVEQEREHQREHEASDHPLCAAELSTEQRCERPGVPGQDQRPQGSCHHVELVQGDERRERGEPEEPPAAEVDEQKHDRQADDRYQHPREELIHRPPYRRRRLA